MNRLRINHIPGVPFRSDASGGTIVDIPPGKEADVEAVLIQAIEDLRAMPMEDPAEEEQQPQNLRPPPVATAGIKAPPPPMGARNMTNAGTGAAMPPPPGTVGMAAMPQPPLKPPPPPPTMSPVVPSQAKPAAPRLAAGASPVRHARQIQFQQQPAAMPPMPSAAPGQQGEAIYVNGKLARPAPPGTTVPGTGEVIRVHEQPPVRPPPPPRAQDVAAQEALVEAYTPDVPESADPDATVQPQG